MKENSFSPIFILLLALPILSCKKEEIKFDAQKAILGKWEITHNTFGPVLNPMEYEEYLPDGTLMLFDYREKAYAIDIARYWFADSLLYKQRIYINHVTKDTLLVDIQPYRYKFLDENTLQLNFQSFVMNPYALYKRIK